MKDSKRVADSYRKRYVDMKFERRGLFALIKEEFNPREVLYPGCSIHITPAFFFPHVVFVDHDPDAVKFFSKREVVLDVVNRHRTYKRSPYVQFIAQDFTQALPIRRDQFDLVLGLFTGGVSKACWSYLKMGGILVTNNHHDDALEASQEDGLTPIAYIKVRKGRYRLAGMDPNEEWMSKGDGHESRRYLRRSRGGCEYVENETYYVFRKDRPRR